MNNLDSFTFAYSIRSRDAATQCKLSVSILSIMVAVYFFFLKKNLFFSIVSNDNFDKLKNALAWSNGFFVCALVLALLSIIAGYLGLDKQALLNLTEAFKSYGGNLNDQSINKLKCDFESKLVKSEKFSGASMLLIVASIVSAILAILIVLLENAEVSVILGALAGALIGAGVWILGYTQFAKPQKLTESEKPKNN